MDVGINGTTERQLRSVLSAKVCWDEECEIIVSPLQIFHYDRLSHALKMLVPGFIYLIIAWNLFEFSIKKQIDIICKQTYIFTIAVSNKMSNIKELIDSKTEETNYEVKIKVKM